MPPPPGGAVHLLLGLRGHHRLSRQRDLPRLFRPGTEHPQGRRARILQQLPVFRDDPAEHVHALQRGHRCGVARDWTCRLGAAAAHVRVLCVLHHLHHVRADERAHRCHCGQHEVRADPPRQGGDAQEQSPQGQVPRSAVPLCLRPGPGQGRLRDHPGHRAGLRKEGHAAPPQHDGPPARLHGRRALPPLQLRRWRLHRRQRVCDAGIPLDLRHPVPTSVPDDGRHQPDQVRPCGDREETGGHGAPPADHGGRHRGHPPGGSLDLEKSTRDGEQHGGGAAGNAGLQSARPRPRRFRPPPAGGGVGAEIPLHALAAKAAGDHGGFLPGVDRADGPGQLPPAT
mmetsp:Transcript_108287/g.345311  ORF Transcript_108287/g.345311 Transcript_108287/m.345311 type:complete len:341 (-) Transcript_108287:447-1469(-)